MMDSSLKQLFQLAANGNQNSQWNNAVEWMKFGVWNDRWQSFSSTGITLNQTLKSGERRNLKEEIADVGSKVVATFNIH